MSAGVYRMTTVREKSVICFALANLCDFGSWDILVTAVECLGVDNAKTEIGAMVTMQALVEGGIYCLRIADNRHTIGSILRILGIGLSLCSDKVVLKPVFQELFRLMREWPPSSLNFLPNFLSKVAYQDDERISIFLEAARDFWTDENSDVHRLNLREREVALKSLGEFG